MLKWIAATIAGVPILTTQAVAGVIAGISGKILVPSAVAMAAFAVVAPGSQAADVAVRNATMVAAFRIAAEGALRGSSAALRWLDEQRNAA